MLHRYGAYKEKSDGQARLETSRNKIPECTIALPINGLSAERVEMPILGSPQQKNGWDEVTCVRATWVAEQVLYSVSWEKENWTTVCMMCVLMTRRHAFETELAGCWKSTKIVDAMPEHRNLTFEILEDVVRREQRYLNYSYASNNMIYEASVTKLN